jgi:choline-sulfatase
MQPYCLVISLVNPHDVLCYPKGFNYGYNDSFLEGEIGLPETVTENLLQNKKPMAQEQILLGSASLLGPIPTDEIKTNYINFYGNMLKWVDDEISYFLQELYKSDSDGENLANNALVIRTSDHGEMGLAHGGLRQKTFVAYEEALRIPLVISNPILFPPYESYKSTLNLASLVDVLPTIAALTGSTAPTGIKGVDLTPLLIEDEPVQDAILFTYDDTKAGSNSVPSAVNAANRIRCIRTTEWKYDYYFDALGAYPMQYELYDLIKDPNEYTNLAYNSDYKKIRMELEIELKKLEENKLLIKPELSKIRKFQLNHES